MRWKLEMTSSEFRSLRRRLHLTQREFAQMLGYSVSQISNLENGISRSTGKPIKVPRVVELALAPVRELLSTRLSAD